MTTCPVCGSTVPPGEYCGACGTSLTTGSVHRIASFAADPAQHILQPNIVSTLFPHVPHRHSTHFRLGLVIAGLLLLGLGLLRSTGPAIAVAAAAVPLLYLLYLYEVEVYDEEPSLVVGLTFGLGLLLGVPWAIFTGRTVTIALLHGMTTGHTAGDVLTAGILLPLLAQVVMLVGSVVLYFTGRYREPLDGFTFGAAGALGFTLATTLVNLAPELRLGPVGGAPVLTNVLMVLGRGLLIPFLNASTTGCIAGALWLRRTPRRPLRFSWVTSLPAALIVAAIVRIVLGMVEIEVLRTAVVVAIYLTVAIVLLFWVRLTVHTMLLVEAEDVTIGPPLPCCNCHRVVPRMAFCPHCGIATAATPRTGTGRVRRGNTPDGSAQLSGDGLYRPATPAEIAGFQRGPHHARRWSAVAGVLVAGCLVLGVTAALLSPARGHACGVFCAPPPPPCAGFCGRAALAPPLVSHNTYTSSAYKFAVDYTQFPPSHQDSSSVGWDLSSSGGQYSAQVLGGKAQGSSAQEIVKSLLDNNFPDYSLVYNVPGAEVGYTPGAGSVYEDQVTPFLGESSTSRVVILSAVKSGLGIAVVASGDASTSDPTDPSGLAISQFVDSLANGTRWPGDPPR